MAAEEASFNTSILSTSLGLISDHGPSKGIPSRITRGLLSAVMELLPRIRVVVDEPSALLPVTLIFNPGTAPCKD